jgi:hypothetical protein
MSDAAHIKEVDVEDAVERRSVLVKAEIKRMLKDMNHQVAGDFIEALNQQVCLLITQASVRADRNGRKQIRSHDL